jgi:hypothetical protein
MIYHVALPFAHVEAGLAPESIASGRTRSCCLPIKF